MDYSLPKTVQIDGEEYEIRTDYRVILTVLEALGDPELSDRGKAECIFELFYVDPSGIRNAQEAVNACYRFIDMEDEDHGKKSPRVMDWQQDFKYIIAPINRVLGYEAREIPYDFAANTGGLHWWTFMAAYMEIGGDCMFSQIVTIRDKQARGKKLEKHERDWLARNRSMVELKQKFTSQETETAKDWMGKNG